MRAINFALFAALSGLSLSAYADTVDSTTVPTSDESINPSIVVTIPLPAQPIAVITETTHIIAGLSQQLPQNPSQLPFLPNIGSGNQFLQPIRDILNPILPGGLPLPAALQELLTGVGPALRCSADIQCFLQTNLGAAGNNAFALGCLIISPSAIDFSFGNIPGGQPAAKWAVDTSIAIECAPGLRYRVVLQSNDGGSSADPSRMRVNIGKRHATLELRSDGILMAEREFVSDGGTQFVPISAFLIEAPDSALTPTAAGKMTIDYSPLLVLQVYR